MKITVICSHCRYHDTNANIEINFRDGKIYYICPECKKESKIKLKSEVFSLPKTKRMQ